MNKSIFKATLAILFFALVLWGCSSKEEPAKNGIEENLNNTLSADVEVQAGNSSLINKEGETSTTKEFTNDVALGTDSSEKVEPALKSSDPNKAMVVFKDEEGKALKTEEVQKGNDATPPDDPEKEGYVFTGWNYDVEDVQTDITVYPVFEEITEPTLLVKNKKAGAGDEIDVPVMIYKNPGFLGLTVNIQYDEKALKLTEVSNGALLGDYVFTPPKNMKSDCNAAWNINDVPEGNEDGEILVLRFKVLKKASAGNYSVSISCLNNAFDDSYNSFSFDSVKGSVMIK